MQRPKIIAGIIVAAGRGERATVNQDHPPKQYRALRGRPILAHTIHAFLREPAISYVLPVIHPEHVEHYGSVAIADPRLLSAQVGGATRQASVLAGLQALAPLKPDYVLIHDAARPFVSPQVIAGVIERLGDHDGAIPATPVTDTIKRAPDGQNIVATEDRRTLFAAQTPQGFRFAQIFSAHMRAATLPREFTDDSAIAEWAGLRLAITPGSPENFKITVPEDFARAELALGGGMSFETRIGTGFDVHPFAEGSAVWLGGVEIPHTHKLQGHSDADAGLHALADALYGALGAGDIGTHFPPSDMRWRGAASSIFLEHAAGMVRERGGRIVNLDLTLVCEAPKISPHVPAMRNAIGRACGIAASRVAVKATTSEKLGFTGRREGIVALASASVELPRED